MRCKCLASDWLTTLCVTVIIPIQLTERHREREKERETDRGRRRERQIEGVRERDREREYERETERGRRRTTGLLVGFWLIEYREGSRLGAPRPGDHALIPTIPGIGARWWSGLVPAVAAPPVTVPPIAVPPDSGGALPRARGLNTTWRPWGPVELSSALAVAWPRGGSSFWIQPPWPGRINVETVVMSDPTICSPTLVSWPRDATLRLVIVTNSTRTNSTLASRGESPAKVGGAMYTNSPTDLSR